MFRALTGYRGAEAVDLSSIVDALVAISHAGPEIIELEVNPMIITANGAVAVDAVVRQVA